MQKHFKYIAAVAVLACASAASHAAVIGSITHDYGSVDGAVANASPGTGSCDTLNTTSITVRDTGTGCARFLDVFNFSSMPAGTITSFTLSLNFANTNDNFGFEGWAIRPASSATVGSSVQAALRKSTAAVSQDFTITNASNPDVFNAIVSGGSFYLWFAENGAGVNNFTLNYATLAVNGTAVVPEPGSLALLGLAALGMGAARRRAGKAAA